MLRERRWADSADGTRYAGIKQGEIRSGGGGGRVGGTGKEMPKEAAIVSGVSQSEIRQDVAQNLHPARFWWGRRGWGRGSVGSLL